MLSKRTSVVFCYFCLLSVNAEWFRLIARNYIYAKAHLEIRRAKSESECLKFCMKNEFCKVATFPAEDYKPNDTNCALHDELFFQQNKMAKIGARTFHILQRGNQKYPAFVWQSDTGRYKISSLTQARLACADLGTKIATKSDLDVSFASGVHFCSNCWVEDGTDEGSVYNVVNVVGPSSDCGTKIRVEYKGRRDANVCCKVNPG